MRPIDADALYQTEKLLGTNIVRRDKVASELLEQVLYDIEHFPTLTPQPLPPPGKDNNVPTNEPLTLDELLTMDGEPVYVVFRPDSSGEKSQSWALVNVDEKYGEVYLVDSIPGASCYYDEIWADLEGIYRRPPEGEEDA